MQTSTPAACRTGCRRGREGNLSRTGILVNGERPAGDRGVACARSALGIFIHCIRHGTRTDAPGPDANPRCLAAGFPRAARFSAHRHDSVAPVAAAGHLVAGDREAARSRSLHKGKDMPRDHGRSGSRQASGVGANRVLNRPRSRSSGTQQQPVRLTIGIPGTTGICRDRDLPAAPRAVASGGRRCNDVSAAAGQNRNVIGSAQHILSALAEHG